MEVAQNRLIIVGNGFDLAHAFPTSYNDFIIHLLYFKFKEALNHPLGFYEDQYFIILKLNNCRFEPAVNIPLNDYFKYLCKSLYYAKEDNLIQIKKSIAERERGLSEIYFHVKDEFIASLFTAIQNTNWVDVEMAYYSKLKEIVFSDPVVRFLNTYTVKDLNNTLDMMRDQLIKYLRTIDTAFPYENAARIFDFPKQYDFRSRVTKADFSNRPNETLVLNFNYTNTLKNYKRTQSWGDDIQILQIHGDLVNKENPVIFGYGDEIEESYKKLELKNDNELLRHMKNKDYALTSNYSKLISFIEQESFEVYILGHSCGLSDRVMLNTIFEHVHCKSINIFYYLRSDGSDDFLDIFHNISRQFSLTKRADLRKKIKSKSQSMYFPQSPAGN